MCGRYQALPRAQVQEIAVFLRGQNELFTSGNPVAEGTVDVYPGDRVCAIDSMFNVVDLIWGFDVEWSKNPVFNTRIESMCEGSQMWQNASENGRCVIPAARFYEPHMREKVRSISTNRAVKRPYLFVSQENEPLLFAALSEDGHCSIVTTQPNENVASVHDRMPLILRPSEVRSWLDGDLSGLADRSAIMLDARPADERPAIVESEQLGLF